MDDILRQQEADALLSEVIAFPKHPHQKEPTVDVKEVLRDIGHTRGHELFAAGDITVDVATGLLVKQRLMADDAPFQFYRQPVVSQCCKASTIYQSLVIWDTGKPITVSVLNFIGRVWNKTSRTMFAPVSYASPENLLHHVMPAICSCLV